MCERRGCGCVRGWEEDDFERESAPLLLSFKENPSRNTQPVGLTHPNCRLRQQMHRLAGAFPIDSNTDKGEGYSYF